jgi:hypothetical protein
MFRKQKGYSCTQCGVVLNISKESYHEHLVTYHGKRQQSISSLKKMTTEEIEAVVKRVEEGWLAPHLYVPSTYKQKQTVKVEPVNEAPVIHDADCKCLECWNKFCDAVLAKQEAELTSMNIPSVQLPEVELLSVKPLEAGVLVQTKDVEWKG